MWIAPVGLAFLIAPNIIKVDNMEEIIGKVQNNEQNIHDCEFLDPVWG